MVSLASGLNQKLKNELLGEKYPRFLREKLLGLLSTSYKDTKTSKEHPTGFKRQLKIGDPYLPFKLWQRGMVGSLLRIKLTQNAKGFKTTCLF